MLGEGDELIVSFSISYLFHCLLIVLSHLQVSIEEEKTKERTITK